MADLSAKLETDFHGAVRVQKIDTRPLDFLRGSYKTSRPYHWIKVHYFVTGAGLNSSSQGFEGERMDAKTLARFRKAMLEEKQRLLNNTKNVKNELALSPDDLPDETDLAASEINQNLIFKLRDRERQLLQKIDEALARMDAGTFGQCQECEEDIEPRRLEARPVSTLCIACKEREEHREKIYA